MPFITKGLGIKDADRERIAAHLAGGRAAVGILVKEDQAAAVSTRLTELGATTESHPVDEEVEAEAAEAAPAVEAAEAEAGDDLTIVDGIGPSYAAALKGAGVKTFAQLSEQTPEGIADTLAKGERAAHRRAQRRHLAPPGEACRRRRLVRTSPLHRLEEVGSAAFAGTTDEGFIARIGTRRREATGPSSSSDAEAGSLARSRVAAVALLPVADAHLPMLGVEHAEATIGAGVLEAEQRRAVAFLPEHDRLTGLDRLPADLADRLGIR